MEAVRTWLGDFGDVPAVQALLVAVAGVLLALLAQLILTRVVLRLVRRTASTLDDRLVSVLQRPIFVTVVLAALHMAARVLALPEPYEGALLAFLVTLVILVWAGAGLRVSRLLLDAVGGAESRLTWVDVRTVPLLDNLLKIAVWGLTLYALLQAWDLDVRPWLATAGIAGIALGFAAKDTLANLFGGLFVIADAPYKLGDYIVLDSGERGVVTRIGLRSTRILTRDDVEITIPNAVIANAKISNESGGPSEKHRVTVSVGVAYGTDVDRARQVLQEAAESVPEVSRDPAPRIRFAEMGDSALIFRVLCWVDRPADRGLLLDAVNTAVYKALGAAGITIPFPQRDVHLKGLPATGLEGSESGTGGSVPEIG